MTLNREQSLGSIVSMYPDTVKVMNQYKLDYCCNGNESLAKAIGKLTVDQNEVLAALEKAMVQQTPEEVTDWGLKTMSELIDHILETHHVFMRETLDELNWLIFKVLKVHFKGHGDQLLKIHLLFGHLKTELEAHLVKEEEHLFPKIKVYEMTKNPELKRAIRDFIKATEAEHDGAGELFKQIEAATDDFTAPEGVCTSYKRMFALLDALEKDTFNHIHLENSVLFTKLEV